MSYKLIKEEIENLTQDHLAKEIYYTNKGECFKVKNEKTEKIFESIQLKANIKTSEINPVPGPNIESLTELNNLNPQEINHGIKFSSVSSGKNIIIHGGGNLSIKFLRLYFFFQILKIIFYYKKNISLKLFKIFKKYNIKSF